MRLLLLIGALLLSLAVPAGAIAIVAASASQSDQQTVDLPVAPTPTQATPSAPSVPQTESVELFDGKTVYVDSLCADSHNLDSHKAEAVAAAKRLPALKQRALDSERVFRQFLDAHPEHDLAPTDYATYKSLKAAYDTDRIRFNRQIDKFNRLADQFNSVLETCKS